MSSTAFLFKQFAIAHDRCAMKVGTDGVLLGAWAEVPARGRLLDVGTGTGLVALMTAQRAPEVRVTGIDIVEDAVVQARENVAASPFAGRVDIRLQSFQDMADGADRFQAIVCNPPFFEETLLPPDAARSMARHTQSLPFGILAEGAARLLTADGTLSVILPATAFDRFRLLCFAAGLALKRSREVRGTAGKATKRVLATFAKKVEESRIETPLILMENGHRSADYEALTRDFYLW